MKIEVVIIHRDPVGTEAILAEIRTLGRTMMTQLQDALARLKAEDDVLAADVDQLLAALAQEPANVADAVQKALAAAGADDATNAAAVDAATAATQSVVDKITAALQPAPAPGGTGSGDGSAGGAGGTDTGSGAGSTSGGDQTGGTAAGGTDAGSGGGAPAPEPAPLALSTGALPGAVVGQGYSSSIGATGGTAPYSFQSSPTSDNGLTVGADGTVTGTPAAPGLSTFAVTVQDSATPPNSASGTVTVDTANG